MQVLLLLLFSQNQSAHSLLSIQTLPNTVEFPSLNHSEADILIFAFRASLTDTDETSLALPLNGASGEDSPPRKMANWIIDNVTEVRDTVIVLNGNLTIQANGNLALNNVTLYLNCELDGEFKIVVENEGHLIIKNSSVTSGSPPAAWYLDAKAGSVLQLVNSTISYAGYAKYVHVDEDGRFSIAGEPGLSIQSKTAEIISCTISNNYFGIYAYWGYPSLSNASLLDSIKIINNTIAYSSAHGIDLSWCDNSTIAGNTIKNSNGSGIYCSSSSSLDITNNFFSRNKNGIELVHLDNATIANNHCSFNRQNGIKQGFSTIDNIIINNICAYNNGVGIHTEYSLSCLVAHNSLANNRAYGVYLGAYQGLLESKNNWVFNNYFAANNLGGIQASDVGDTNIWENNYWDDHTEPDGNGDGIVDSPYEISRDASDPYPLVEYTYISEDSPQHGESDEPWFQIPNLWKYIEWEDSWVAILAFFSPLAIVGVFVYLLSRQPWLSPKSCIHCGAIVRSAWKYCVNCGTTIEEESTEKKIEKDKHG